MTFVPYKQKEPQTCIACVAAMATGTTPEDFVDFLRKEYPGRDIKPPYHDVYFQRYILEFNMIVGVGLALVGRPGKSEDLVGVSMHTLEEPALVSVSCGEEIEHAVYWDGKKIWDPNPDVEDGRHPLFYRIVGWWPIQKIDARGYYLPPLG